MKTTLCFLAALLCGSHLHAQPAATPDSKQEPLPRAYFRRISFGATLSVMGLNVIPGKITTNLTTAPPVNAAYTTTGASQRIGYGGVVQVAITERFAVNISLLTRRIGYKMNSDIFTGIENPLAIVDPRKHIIRDEDTQARVYDLPVMIQYYGRNRHAPKLRWFVEGGGSVRRVTNIKTSTGTTLNTGTPSCCDLTAAVPANRTARGVVAGAGVYFKDDFGIHIVPEVRYTRWFNPTFQSFSTGTQANQVEAMVSLTF